MAQLRYRARQFFGARAAQIDPADRTALLQAGQVPASLASLFERMPVPYQWHALNVARHLQAEGHSDPILLQAALLHDMGKWDPASNRRVSLGVRSAAVVLEHVPGGEGLMQRLAAGNPPATSRRYSWYLHRHHPRRSADLAAAHGSPPEAVELIRYHARRVPGLSPAQQARLTALQAADDEE
jgi:hypothetical protein